MKYIIYLRVSTEEQDLRTQEQKCLRFLKQKFGKNIKYCIFYDELSSRKPLNKREGIQAALNALREGDTLVGQRIDRIARNEVELHYIRDFIEEEKMEILMVDQPEINNKFVFSLYATFASMEISLIRDRIRDKLKEKQERGERTGGIRYGFTLDEANLILVNGKDKKKELKAGSLIENEREQVCLKYMCELFDQGFSYRQIAKMINFAGYKNRKGNDWDHATVYRILIRIGRTRFLPAPPETADSPWTRRKKRAS